MPDLGPVGAGSPAAVSTCRRLRGNDTDSACPAPPRVRVFYGNTLRTALRAALDAGYTYVDTAEGYHNEAVVGEVLADYDREDVFLTSKVLAKHLHYGGVIEACEASLDRLDTGYTGRQKVR